MERRNVLRSMAVAMAGSVAAGAAEAKFAGSTKAGPEFISAPADGKFLIYVDKEMDDVSHVDLNDTPAGLLLKANMSFADPAVKLIGVKQGPGTVEITAAQSKEPAAGQLTFVFNESPYELKQWRVLDAQNKEVRVTLQSARPGVKLDSKLFSYDARKQKSDRD